MAYTSIPAPLRAGGGSGLHGDSVVQLARALAELQGLKVSVAAGAGANTNIAVAGIATEDTVAAVVQQDTTTMAIEAHAGVVTVFSAGNIRSTVSTVGKTLVVVWYNKS
jgi:hypothetical protein